MNNKEAYERLEKEKFKYRDDAIIYREREAAVAALNFSTFVTAFGPLGICLMKAVNALPYNGVVLPYLLYATAPLGLLLTLINWGRTPKDYRGAKPIVRSVLLAVAAALSTFILAGYWGLRKGVTDSP